MVLRDVLGEADAEAECRACSALQDARLRPATRRTRDALGLRQASRGLHHRGPHSRLAVPLGSPVTTLIPQATISASPGSRVTRRTRVFDVYAELEDEGSGERIPEFLGSFGGEAEAVEAEAERAVREHAHLRGERLGVYRVYRDIGYQEIPDFWEP